MKRCAQKLHSRRGASILLAMFLMLVAVMISTVIVSAALTAANRVYDDKAQQQDALSLTSAGKLVSKYFQDSSGAKRYSADDYESEVFAQEGITDANPDPDNLLKKLYEKTEQELTMEVNGVPAGMREAVMDFQVTSDGSKYTVKGTIALKGEDGTADPNSQKLYLQAEFSYKKNSAPKTVTVYEWEDVPIDPEDPSQGVTKDWVPYTKQATLYTETWTMTSVEITTAEGVLWESED